MSGTQNNSSEDSQERRDVKTDKDYFERVQGNVTVYAEPVHIHQGDPRQGDPRWKIAKQRNLGKALKNLFLVLASQIPVLGIAVTWWAGVLKQPIVAAGLAVVYELLVLFWRELGKPVWEEVWEQELKPQAVRGLATWLKVTVLNLFFRFRHQYNHQLIYDHRVFPVRGLLTPGQGALEVEQVFVELQIAPSHFLQISTNPIAVKVLAGSQSVWEFLRRLKKQKATALAILGPPGCGKTTLLKHLALAFAAKRHRQYRVRTHTPILLFLREHAKLITEEAPSLGELAQRYFGDQKRYPELTPPPYWFARQLRMGKCLVLLDGLDEVVEAEQRQNIVDWVDRQIRTYPRCQFLLTARPQGYRDAPLARAQVLEVLPFNADQVSRFIHNWYLATKLIAYGKDDRGVRQDAEREAQDLLQRLQERPHLKDLTVNPLLLTMITNVHNYRGALPERRVELYSEICDVLLGHWQKAKGVFDRLTAAQKREVLQPLAEEMMTRKVREIAAQDALAVMTPHLVQVGVSDNDIPTFLGNVQASSGLLLEKEMGVWNFAHLTFQEYLCAAHWDKTGKAADWDAAQWQKFIVDSWWHETLRLYAAQRDATPLVNACLQANSNAALSLAGDIAEEALKLDKSTRETMTKSLEERLVICLRSEPLTVSEKEFLEVFKLNEDLQPLEYIQNDYEDQGEVVFDRATGLMWQKSGSKEYMTYDKTRTYIDQLNKEQFAGHNDWRLPTIPELMSLLEPEEKNDDLYIDPIFDKTQRYCWSADRLPEGETGSSESAWLVHFGFGYVYWGVLYGGSYVRAVRS